MDAISLLLEGRSKDRWDAKRWRLLIGAFTLPVLFFWLIWGEGLVSYLVTVAGLALLVLPVHHLATEVSVLESLRRGRCLEELLTAGVRAESLVDALPRHALKSLLPRLLGLLPVLGLSTLLLPAFERKILLVGLSLWIPLTATFLTAGSYLCQGWILNPRAVGPRLLWLLLPLALVPYNPVTGLTLSAFLLVVGCWWSRAAAIHALLHPRARAPRRVRSWQWPQWSQNPIVIRELKKLSRARLLAWTFLPLLLVGTYPGGGSLVMVGLLAFAGAAAVTVNALPAEREGKTLDALIQSGLSLKEFLQGWVLAVAAPRTVALLPLMLALPFFECDWRPRGHHTLNFGDPWYLGTVLASELALLLAPLGGALLGLWAGSLVGERRRARGHLVTGLLAGFGLLCGIWGGLALGVWGVFHEWLGWSTSWFDDIFLFGFSPMLSMVLGTAVIGLFSGAVLRKRMSPVWAGREPVAESRSERAILYCEGALNSLWGPGALAVIPALCGALGMILDEFRRWDDELIWAACLFMGIAFMSAIVPWLLLWRPTARMWARVKAPGALLMGLFLGGVATVSYVLFLSIAGDIAEQVFVPSAIATVVTSVVGAVRVYTRD